MQQRMELREMSAHTPVTFAPPMVATDDILTAQVTEEIGPVQLTQDAWVRLGRPVEVDVFVYSLSATPQDGEVSLQAEELIVETVPLPTPVKERRTGRVIGGIFLGILGTIAYAALLLSPWAANL